MKTRTTTRGDFNSERDILRLRPRIAVSLHLPSKRGGTTPRAPLMMAVGAVVLVLFGAIAWSLRGGSPELEVTGWQGLPGASTTEVAPAVVERSDVLASGGWVGARTTDGGGLLVVLAGAPAFDLADPCSVDYLADVEETASEVRVTITGRSPATNGPLACRTKAHHRELQVHLEAPLGERRLIEAQFDREQPVFDGAQLLAPGWLPNGWQLLRETPGRSGAADVWSRTWGELEPPPLEGRCVPSSEAVTLTQGPAGLTATYPRNGARPVGEHQVRGQPATSYEGGAPGSALLTWTDGSAGYAVQASSRCQGDAPVSVDALVRIADSLQ